MRDMKKRRSLDDILSANAREKVQQSHSVHHTKSPVKNINSSAKEKGTLKQRISSWIFLMPSLLGVLLFFGAPFCVVIYYSFVNNPVQHEFRGLWNYGQVLRNYAFRKAAMNTLRFSAITVPLAVVLSLLLAMILESKIPGKSAFRSMFLSTMMVPIASIVLIWQVLFHYNGLVNQILGALLHIPQIDWLKSEHAQFVIIILFLWKNLGYNMILFMAALSSVPKDQLEVAKLESANAWQTFWYVKIRYLSSTILFVALMSLINSFKVFRETYLMTGDYPHEALYMLQHYMNNMFNSLDYQNLSAASIMMSIVVIIVVAFLFYIEERVGKDVEDE